MPNDQTGSNVFAPTSRPVASGGIDFYVETFLDAPDNGRTFATVLKFRLTPDVVAFVGRMSKAVCDLEALQIQTAKMPGIETVVSNDDSCGMWAVEVDSEAFHFSAGEGPPGLVSVNIFIEELDDMLAERCDHLLYSRHGGALILRSGLTPEDKMLARVEAAFPEMAAARVGQQMSTAIQATLASTDSSTAVTAARPRNRTL
ncbi:hypothetical protein ABIC83_002499 [Roseateles asaccharophilus]|uniref:hypothetical protein n=1 Tax=Roseateles asaccharophilus TaxID=582607 RepID=UPI0038334FE5